MPIFASRHPTSLASPKPPSQHYMYVVRANVPIQRAALVVGHKFMNLREIEARHQGTRIEQLCPRVRNVAWRTFVVVFAKGNEQAAQACLEDIRLLASKGSGSTPLVWREWPDSDPGVEMWDRPGMFSNTPVRILPPQSAWSENLLVVDYFNVRGFIRANYRGSDALLPPLLARVTRKWWSMRCALIQSHHGAVTVNPRHPESDANFVSEQFEALGMTVVDTTRSLYREVGRQITDCSVLGQARTLAIVSGNANECIEAMERALLMGWSVEMWCWEAQRSAKAVHLQKRFPRKFFIFSLEWILDLIFKSGGVGSSTPPAKGVH